jgi:hypothetical protein
VLIAIRRNHVNYEYALSKSALTMPRCGQYPRYRDLERGETLFRLRSIPLRSDLKPTGGKLDRQRRIQMKKHIQSVNTLDLIGGSRPFFPLLFYTLLGCSLAVAFTARAATPPLDGGYQEQNTAGVDDALFSVTTGANVTATGFDALYSNTTGSDNALASWTWRATGSLDAARESHTATLLQNGMVLVAAGVTTNATLASAELYDPASGTWTATGSLNTGRTDHTATLLQNGMVLVAAGFGDASFLASAELYDPTSGTWTTTGSLRTPRFKHTATLLQNGRVLVAAGFDDHGASTSAELYDPASGTWTATRRLRTARFLHTATLLGNGMVLVAGGRSNIEDPTASAELYDPASQTWTATGSLTNARYSHTATLLENGRILVAAGTGANGPLASAELGHRQR